MPKYTKEDTYQALLYPRGGDYFTEVFAYRAIVVKVEPNRVWWVETTMSRDGELKSSPRDKFIEEFTYPGTSDRPWLRLIERDVDVAGWFDYLTKPEEKAEHAPAKLAKSVWGVDTEFAEACRDQASSDHSREIAQEPTREEKSMVEDKLEDNVVEEVNAKLPHFDPAKMSKSEITVTKEIWKSNAQLSDQITKLEEKVAALRELAQGSNRSQVESTQTASSDSDSALLVAVQDLLSELRIDSKCLEVMANGYSPDYPGAVDLQEGEEYVNPYVKVQLSKVVARKLLDAGVVAKG